MKVLLVTTGSRGDIEPFIALAVGLRERGHAATVAAPARFASLASEYGVAFRGLDDSLLDLQDTLASGGTLQAVAGASKARVALERFLSDVVDLTDLQPDVVVYHPKTLAAPMLAERQGVPAIAAQLIPLYQPTAGFSAPILSIRVPRFLNQATWTLVPLIEAPWGKMLRRLRRERFGLTTPVRGMGDHIREQGALNAWSPHLLPAPREWGADAAPTGFWRLPGPDQPPSDRLVDFLAAGDPPVYVGFGSMVHAQPSAVGEAITRGLRSAGRRGVVATGSGAIELTGGDDILVVENVPHAWLFPRVTAAVHHGGVGTTAAALAAGIPQIINPFLGDQHFWARRAESIGVAVRLQALAAEAIAEAITGAHALTPRAQALSRSVRDEQGVAVAVTRLEQLVFG